MDQLVSWLPLLFGLLVPVGAIICVWLVFKKSSSNKDLMLQQLMTKNKDLEEKVNQLQKAINISDEQQ